MTIITKSLSNVKVRLLNFVPISLFSILLLLSGCAAISEFTAETERERQEKQRLEETVQGLQLKEAELHTGIQNLTLEVARLKGDESVFQMEIERLGDEKADLEAKLTSCRKHQGKLEAELVEADRRLAGMIGERKGRFVELDKIKRELSSGLEGYSGVSFEERGDASAIILENALTLKSGKVRIRKSAFPLLKKLAKILGKFPAHRLKISGHTDDIPIKVSYPDNWELSAARALAILHYLEEQGIEPARMSAVGCGEYMPRETNTTPEGRAKNRRAEILVLRIQ
jgi:chemotaxis protein MotB